MQSLPLNQKNRLQRSPDHSIARRRKTYAWLLLTAGCVSSALAQPHILIPTDTHDHQNFGASVAISGNALAATSDPAGASTYIFRFNGTAWIQEQIIGPPRGTYNAALEGNVLAIPDVSGAGSIYRYDGAAWQFEQAVQEPVGEPDLNGRAALSGSHLLLGALGPRAYVYRYNAGAWTHAQTLSTPAADKTTVAIRGDYLAVGSDQTVSVFHFDGTMWQLDTTLTIPGPSIHFAIDYPLALDPPYLMVGHLQAGGAAAVRVYSIASGSWNVLQDLQSPALSSGTGFGYGVSIDGDMAVIGAPTDFGGHGEAWVLRLCDGLWQTEQRITTPTGTVNQFFAGSVAIENGKAVLGAPNHFTSAGFGAGEAYVYDAIADCNSNGVGDGCELTAPSADCDRDFVLDQCQPFLDCNANTRRDACDIADLTSADCNQTGTPDECDIASASSPDADHDGIPDECFVIECPPAATLPMYSLKAVSINGQRVPPSNSIVASPGDQIEAEIYIMCWGTQLDFLQTYQVGIFIEDGATSGEFGSIMPLGWDGPLQPDFCPCTDPAFPICDLQYGCVGPQHQPGLGASLDFLRPDFLLAGHSTVTAVDTASLSYFRWGATVFGDETIDDLGLARYGGTLRVVAGEDACGNFEFIFHPEYSFLQNAGDSGNPPLSVVPQFEPLTINLCANDGQFCNGIESCNPQLGCQVIPPPSCNDGVACTLDSCNEVTDGCAHALNHAACDDGNICTRDECSPTGCINIDDQCGDIPAASSWGLAVLALLLLVAAKLRFGRLRPAAP